MASKSSTTVLMLSLATSVSAGADLSAEYFRWPYKHSPYVIESNKRDGLPDFSFDAGAPKAKLTPSTISCPEIMQHACTSDAKLPKMSGTHVSCGTDGNQGCYGGLTCFFETDTMNSTTLKEYVPNFTGAVQSIFGKKSRKLQMTRRTILQRAIGWLALNAPYFGCHVPAIKYTAIETCAEDDDAKCPQYSWTATCEGLTAMPLDSTAYGGNYDTAASNYWKLQPGDVITHHTPSGGTAHFMLFREWVEVNKTARIYQMGGGTGSANLAQIDTVNGAIPWCEETDPTKHQCYTSGTYKYIKEE